MHLALLARAAQAADATESEFIALNDSHVLAPYRQAALWRAGRGVAALSGVASIERNAPYVLWLDRMCAALQGPAPRALVASDLPQPLAEEWSEWLPPYGLWIPLALPGMDAGLGGVLFAREQAWSAGEIEALSSWLRHWALARNAVQPFQRPARLTTLLARLRSRRRALGVTAVALLAVLLFPVRLSVLAPGELVPAEPVPVRAPMDGVVRQFLVKPNQPVRAGEPLFTFDALQIAARLEVATQALMTAEAELRQYDQQSLSDAKARAALATARGNVAERAAEVELLREQHGRTQVLAPHDGLALFDDAQEWIGKPATTGDRILRIASENDKEIEAWIPAGDAIPLAQGDPARLYLSASPLDPVTGALRYYAYDAAKRPDGVYAYRIRAALDQPTPHRIGLKGTARLSGRRVPLVYWMLRRPFAAVREFLGA